MATSVYQQGGYGTAALFPEPVIAPRDPTTNDKVSPTGQPYQVFQGWNNTLTDSCFIYLGAGNWASLAAVTGTVTQLTGDSGTALPSGGSIKIAGGAGVVTSASGSTVTIALTGGGVAIDSFVPDAGTNPVVPTAAGAVTMAGTANQITTTGGLNSLTFSIPATFIAPGSIEATTTITAGTGITATTGNIVATAGQVNAGTTITAGTGITATTGNIAASAGAVTATNTGANRAFVGDTSGGTGVTATLTSSGATVDALQLSGGSIQVPAGTNTPGASPQVLNVRTGQVGFTDTIANGAAGTLTMTNSLITSSSVIIATASCATVNSSLNVSTITPGVGTVDFVLWNAGSASTGGTTIFINFWILN